MNEQFNWHEYDKKHVWHPYSSLKSANLCYPIASADGVYLQIDGGKKLIDGMSSWWAAIHGYNHPILNQALLEQTQKMSHIMFGGLTHEPGVTLAKKLIDLTDPSLDAVFFSDSGSVAVEVAMKMAFQYWIAQGNKKKNKLLTVHNGYHGDTFATMSVCDPINGMHQLFDGIIKKHFFAPAPQCSDNDDFSINELEQLKQQLQQHHDQIAAIIIEPIVQGAGGMRVYCSEYLNNLRQLCDEFKILLIFDEIATGFGRTGSLFAYQQTHIVPDILCLGKALTGGYMTLAATLANQKVVDGIHHTEPSSTASSTKGILMHGPTFMGNPLACAVANASIDLLLASNWQAKVQKIEQQMQRDLSLCLQLSIVKDVRVKGAVGVVELNQAVDMAWIQERFVQLGVWVRPFNKLVYIMPAYIITTDELSILNTSILIVLKEMETLTLL